MDSGDNAVSKDWLSWFDSRESASAINKSRQDKLFSTFDHSISKSNCIDLILNHQQTTFLHKANFGEKKISIFHHLQVSGGTVYDTTAKTFGFIQGIRKDTLITMTPDIDILSKVESAAAVHVPTMTIY